MRLKHPSKILLLFILSWALFIVYYLEYPLAFSLPADYDSWGNLGMFKLLESWLVSLFSDTSPFNFLYPEKEAWKAYGADFGSGIFFVIFRMFGASDLWSFWLAFTFVLALNVVALTHLFRSLGINSMLAIGGSVLFCLSAFTTGNADHLNILVLAPFVLSLSFFIRFLNNGGGRTLIICLLLCALQLYLSPYAFLLNTLSLTCLAAGAHRNFAEKARLHFRPLLAGILILIAAMLPFFVMYVFSAGTANWINLVNRENIAYWSLNPGLISWLPYKGLYGLVRDIPVQPFFELHHYHIGFTIWILAALGLYKCDLKNKRGLLIMALAGLVFAFGPRINLGGGSSVPNVILPLYEVFHLYDFIRVPLRFFFMVQLVLFVFAMYYLQKTMGSMRFRRSILFASLMALLFILENLDLNREPAAADMVFASKQALTEASQQGAIEPDMIVLHLPSDCDPNNIFGMRREYKYIYFASAYGSHTLNGATAFASPRRYELDEALNSDDLNSVSEWIIEEGVDRIVLHDDLILDDYEAKLLQHIRSTFKSIWSSKHVEVLSE